MATYIWVPVRDKELDAFAAGQCRLSTDPLNPGFANRGVVRYLKRPSQRKESDLEFLKNWVGEYKKFIAAWKDVRTDDHVMIAGHGFVSSSQKIGWIGKYPHDDVTSWTFDELAQAIGGLTVTNGIGRLNFTLCMCFGADPKEKEEAFASQFATSLTKYKVTGTVTAFGGAMLIDPHNLVISVAGTSRNDTAGTNTNYMDFAIPRYST